MGLGLLFPVEVTDLVQPGAAAQLLGEAAVLGHARHVEVVIGAGLLPERVDPREARARRPAARRARIHHDHLGAGLREPVGDVRPDNPRPDDDDTGLAHRPVPFVN